MESNLIKGGAGSGSWSGPGQPRFARSVVQSLQGLPPKKLSRMLEKLKAERYARLKRKPGEKPVKAKEKPKPEKIQKPKTEEKPSKDSEKPSSRSHILEKTKWDEKKRLDQIIEDTGVNEKKARQIRAAIEAYAGNDYRQIRKGKMPEKADLIEELIDKSPKWDGNGPVYRGSVLPINIAAKLKKGTTINMKGLSSWSSDFSVGDTYNTNLAQTKGFAKITYVMPKSDTGISIAHYSFWPSEREILVSSKTRYKISKIETPAGPFPKLIIHVDEILSGKGG